MCNFQPNINLLTKDYNTENNDDSDEFSDEQDTSMKITKKSIRTNNKGLYVPPKLSAVHFDDDNNKFERNRKQLERARKRVIKYDIKNTIKKL